jgi:alanine racemase
LNNWIEIAEEHLAANFRTLQAAAGADTEVLAVVKANAYGHGAERCAVTLAHAGAHWLGVTCVSEGIRLRQALAHAGLANQRLLVMCGFFAADVPHLRQYDLTPVVWTLEQLQSLAGLAIPIHIEVDTGMSRQGARPGPELAQLLDAMQPAGLHLEGVLTHFASSDEVASPLTHTQQQRFADALAQTHTAGLHPRWVHAGASSAVDNPTRNAAWLAVLAASFTARAMVRPGIALYGHTMPILGPGQPVIQPTLRPVMTWKARVLSIRTLAPGETIGYNATYTASAPMRVALLPVGFADGLRRELSSTNQRPGGWVMLHGLRAPILGRISMNLTVVDVTHVAAARPGDDAIVLGPGISADVHARLAHTTAYEILCGIHPCG